MVRLTVLYGKPDDPTAFDRYYREVHLPIAKKMQGIRGWTIGKCESAIEGEEPPYYMIVGIYADTRTAFDTMFESAEGKATLADVENFATGGCTFMYDVEEVLVGYQLD